MHRINTVTAPIVFLYKLTKPCHLHPTRFSQKIILNQPTNSIDVDTEFQ